jgi:hypothetical protein
LGLKWTIEWESDYQTTALAEGFAALLQILLADLRKIELSLFPTEVHITIEIHSGKLHIEDNPSNDRVIRKIYLPQDGLGPELVFGVAATILKVVSAYPEKKFLRIIQDRMKLGLVAKTNPHAPYDVLFREFYPKDGYDALHKLGLQSAPLGAEVMISTHEDLNGPSGIHKDYDRGESLQSIKNRYAKSPGLLKYTLPRLMKTESFRSTVAALRGDGWKDWHILLAVGGIRLNFVANQTIPKGAKFEEYRKTFGQLMDRDEAESDPPPPPDMFTIDDLQRALTFSQLSTLKGMGFDCWQETPVTKAVDAFLQRFNYWVDDVDHGDPFA